MSVWTRLKSVSISRPSPANQTQRRLLGLALLWCSALALVAAPLAGCDTELSAADREKMLTPRVEVYFNFPGSHRR
jgi:hypothetical protein